MKEEEEEDGEKEDDDEEETTRALEFIGSYGEDFACTHSRGSLRVSSVVRFAIFIEIRSFTIGAKCAGEPPPD